MGGNYYNPAMAGPRPVYGAPAPVVVTTGPMVGGVYDPVIGDPMMMGGPIVEEEVIVTPGGGVIVEEEVIY